MSFALEQFNWRRAGPAAWVRLPGEAAVATFDTAADAHAECARREADARAVVGHPFRCGATLAEFTTFPDYAFLDWMRDADIDPPDPDPDGRTPWNVWADLYLGEWSAGQLARLWEGANRVRFFRVRERAGEPLHCVLRVKWAPDMNDSNYHPQCEGGTPTTVWHDRSAADRDRDAKQRLAADEMVAALATISEAEARFDPRRRPAAGEPFADVPTPEPTDATAAVHCEVMEVERGEPDAEPLTDTAFVVVRLGWDPLTDDAAEVHGLFDRQSDAGGVPVRVFARQADAELYRDEREAEYRAFANPYRFRPPAVQGGHWGDDRVVQTVHDLGINPPVPNPATGEYVHQQAAWADWWARVGDRLTDAQRSALWELTWDYSDRLALYAVRPVRVGGAGGGGQRRAVRTMYYVRATDWAPGGGPGHNPLRFLGAFADRSRAEAVRDEAERRFRESPPPEVGLPMAWEEYRGWETFSSMSLDQMWQHLAAHGLTYDAGPQGLPDPHWWEANRSRLNPQQVKAVWQVFDRVRLYEVLALPTEVDE